MKHQRLRSALARRPVSVWPAPDFMPRPQRTPLLAWLLLIVGLLAFALAGTEWWQARRSVEEAQQGLMRWQQALRPARAVPTRAAAAAPTDNTAAAAQALSRRLEHPWQTLFQATETEASPAVRWLRLEHDADRGAVRLEGVASDLAALLLGLDALGAAAGWHDVSLLRVDTAADGPNAPPGPLRFELRARHSGTDATVAARP